MYVNTPREKSYFPEQTEIFLGEYLVITLKGLSREA